jgi:hypothetical protein
MATREKAPPARPARHARPAEAPAPRPRDAAAVITELLRPRVVPTCSREEQAFIDLQRTCHQ